MADDLIFPSNDPFTMIEDLGSTILTDDVLSNDINPAFPQSELLNIPQLVPPVISPNEDRNVFSAVNSITNAPYTPISQLMKQTEQLASTLDHPLNTNSSEQLHFGHLQNNSLHNQFSEGTNRSPMLNNGTNSMNSSNHVSAPNTQCLVMGGQRVEIPSQESANDDLKNLNVVNSTGTNMSVKQVKSDIPNLRQSDSSTEGNSKHSLVLKVPSGTQNSKLKGQIVKTADQRLMFVTEVNGKRVGYIIQQAAQPTVSQQQTVHHLSNQKDDATLNGPSHTNSSVIPALSNKTSFNTNMSQRHNNNDPSSIESVKIVDPVLGKREYSKTLKEKLQSLRNPMKNQRISKAPIKVADLGRTVEEEIAGTGIFENEKKIQVNPVSQIINPTVKNIVGEFDTIMKDGNDEINSTVNEDEEEGQEIEFSENDLTGDFHEDSNDSLRSPTADDYLESNIKMEANAGNFIPQQIALSTDDDEDSIPLSLLKNESEYHMSAADELESQCSVVAKSYRKNESSEVKKDSLPLSVVAASLKKPELKTKKKKKVKKKKRDGREPAKPLLAYQLFFRERQSEIREKDAQLAFGEVSKIVAHMWEVLDEKKKKIYQETHNNAKAEYDIKMKEYKELLAKEASKMKPSLEAEKALDYVALEDETKSETQNWNTRKDKELSFHKTAPVTTETVETYDRDILAEVMASDEIPIETILDNNSLTEPRSGKPKSFAAEDHSKSPSLPSSDSSSEDEDSESAISRIRQKAAELKKKITEEKKATQKNKTKDVNKRMRQTKMEIETISQIEEMEPVRKVEKYKLKKEKLVEKVVEPLTIQPVKSYFKIPKKSSAENGQPSGPRLCVRSSCQNPAKITRERGGQYCSNECLVLYCREVFDSWVMERQAEEMKT